MVGEVAGLGGAILAAWSLNATGFCFSVLADFTLAAATIATAAKKRCQGFSHFSWDEGCKE
jgi:hypothetical protein